jgi:hypothetical protein
MPIRSVSIALALALVLFPACVPATSESGGYRRNPDLITSEEIVAARAFDAYALVQSLRPSWLRLRGQSTPRDRGVIYLYQDGVMIGSVRELRNISINSIDNLRFFNGVAATQRWGTGHEHGAIMITSRR